MIEQKFVDWPLSKSYFELCILFVINFVYSVFIYNTVTQFKGKFLRASEVISQVTK